MTVRKRIRRMVPIVPVVGPLLIALGSSALALPPGSPADAPTAAPSAAVERGPEGATGLREIGRVRATSPFCATLRDSTVTAADSALTFQNAALVAIVDIVALEHAENALDKHAQELQVEGEVRELSDLSRRGGAELADLRGLASTSTPAERTALLGLRDALDGAKSRQHRLAKRIADLAGAAAAAPPTGFLDVANEQYLSSLRNRDGGIAVGAEERVRGLLPENDDEEIRRDLATAASDAETAVVLGSC